MGYYVDVLNKNDDVIYGTNMQYKHILCDFVWVYRIDLWAG